MPTPNQNPNLYVLLIYISMEGFNYWNKNPKETNQRLRFGTYSEAATENYIDVLNVLSKSLQNTCESLSLESLQTIG